jgi:2,5-furandicarboxylate decarboxylase 1
MQVPVIEVTAITHRRNGIVEDFWPGHMDHWNLGSIPKEGSVYNVIKKNIPGIKAIHLPPSGAGRCIAYISIKKEFENEPNKAGMQAFVEMPNLKLAVIVDDDVDVFNEREVMWAVATRVHWDKDIEIIREVQSFRGWLGDPGDIDYHPAQGLAPTQRVHPGPERVASSSTRERHGRRSTDL